MLEQIIKIGKSDKIKVYKPSECNYCNKSGDLIFCNAFVEKYYSDYVLCVSYKCQVCQQIIICKYHLDNYGCFNLSDYGILPPYEILGGSGVTKEFTQEINELNPSFVKIFNDSYKAEQLGLNEVVGLGYRRAFEFLIIDYALSIESDDDEKSNIKEIPLSNVIKSYFPDGQVKDLLLRAAWIGNDFAHYESKHPDIQVNQLKELLLLSVSKIDEEIRTRKYIENIEKK